MELANFYPPGYLGNQGSEISSDLPSSGSLNSNELISFHRTNQASSQKKESYKGFYAPVIFLISIQFHFKD